MPAPRVYSNPEFFQWLFSLRRVQPLALSQGLFTEKGTDVLAGAFSHSNVKPAATGHVKVLPF